MISALGSFGNAKTIKSSTISNFASIPGKILWLDASDPNNTGVLPANNTTITTWKDKSGGGRNATATGSIILNTTGLNGLPALTFTGGQYLLGTIASTTATLTIFGVFTMSSSSGSTVRLLSLGQTGFSDYNNAQYMCFIRQSGNGIQGYRRVQTNTNNPASINTPYLFETWYDGINNYNTVHQGESTIPTSVASADGNFNISAFGVGISVETSDTARLYGFVSEIVVYNTALSTAQRQYVEGYLSYKWGLQSKLKSDHPYYNIVSDFVFKIKGSATVPTATTAGVGYSTAYTITNTNSVATATVGTRTNVFSFSGSNSLFISYNLPTIFTRTFWLSCANPSLSNNNVFSSTKNPVFFSSTTFLYNITNFNNGPWSSCVSTIPQTSTWIFYAITQTSTDVKMYVNGTLSASQSSSGTNWSGDTGNIYFGAFPGNIANYTGYIDDIRLYGRALSATEIQFLYSAG